MSATIARLQPRPRTPSNTLELPTRGLPPGKTADEALQRASDYWKMLLRTERTEEVRLRRIQKFCTGLYEGDHASGAILASAAIWCAP